jgi:hypothetical protein
MGLLKRSARHIQAQLIIDGVGQIQARTQVPLGSRNRSMPE